MHDIVITINKSSLCCFLSGLFRKECHISIFDFSLKKKINFSLYHPWSFGSQYRDTNLDIKFEMSYIYFVFDYWCGTNFIQLLLPCDQSRVQALETTFDRNAR